MHKVRTRRDNNALMIHPASDSGVAANLDNAGLSMGNPDEQGQSKQ
jgi:hypothetical protein